MITAIQEGMARFNRLGLEASTALKTSMVWRAAHNIREAEEMRQSTTITFNGQTFYASPDGVFRSLDGGSTITKVEPYRGSNRYFFHPETGEELHGTL